ncbi:hypothetical protein JW835_05135 [bacterium]|nr:hypothetical protein [bacterium]
MHTRKENKTAAAVGLMGCLYLVLSAHGLIAQQDSLQVSKTADTIPYQSMVGPRIGITLLTGKAAAKLKDKFDAGPVITQFGWQWETRFFTVEGGVTAVTEFVLLVGGMEQGILLPSFSTLVGIRSASGAEFGLGPNISLAGVGYVIALGVTKTSGRLNFPMNVSLAMSKKGVRISFLVGFNAVKI